MDGYSLRILFLFHYNLFISVPGAGGGKQDEVDKTKSPLSTQTVPGSDKENVARTLFDKTSSDNGEASIVPERGEPEGESKQPVVTAQRQVRLTAILGVQMDNLQNKLNLKCI